MKFSAPYAMEEEVRFLAHIKHITLLQRMPMGTTFAGTGKVCSESFTPNKARAERLRTQKYW